MIHLCILKIENQTNKKQQTLKSRTSLDFLMLSSAEPMALTLPGQTFHDWYLAPCFRYPADSVPFLTDSVRILQAAAVSMFGICGTGHWPSILHGENPLWQS